ncbi:MAG: YihY/virulence factor BrkB family protein [Actinocrinis sp.]
MRYRITGLAAEAAFWVLLSLPALALGIVGVLGYLHGELGSARATHLETDLTNLAGSVLSQREVHQTVTPALHSMLTSGHADVVSVSFLVALWSGSRALNVTIDTITVASGQNGRRGIVRTRLLSLVLYLPALMLGVAAVSLLLAGTELLAAIVPGASAVLGPLAWPIVGAALVAFLTTLYHLALPERHHWREGLPGALVALAVWAAGSALLRIYLHTGQYGGSGGAGFGRLAATAAILLWLYITALAVLIGAVFNAVRPDSHTDADTQQPGSAQETRGPAQGTGGVEETTRIETDESHAANGAIGATDSATTGSADDPAGETPDLGEPAGEKAVDPCGARGENNPETVQFSSPRMTRSSA